MNTKTLFALLPGFFFMFLSFSQPSHFKDGGQILIVHRMISSTLYIFIGAPAAYGLFVGFLMVVGSFTHDNKDLLTGLGIAGVSMLALVLLIWLQVKRETRMNKRPEKDYLNGKT